MSKLSLNWITDGTIDFEYKKYILLAYLKKVKHRFTSNKLYPELGELVMHFNNLKRLQEHKTLLFENFPKRLNKVELHKLKLTYKQIIDDDELMRTINEIIEFSIPQLEKQIDTGKHLYDFVEDQISYEPIGVLPIYQKEGYILLNEDKEKEVRIYNYQVSLISHTNESFQAMYTRYVGNKEKSLVNTYNNIKLSLIKRFKNLTNPATFLFVSKYNFPIEETLLPIIKRKILTELKLAA